MDFYCMIDNNNLVSKCYFFFLDYLIMCVINIFFIDKYIYCLV